MHAPKRWLSAAASTRACTFALVGASASPSFLRVDEIVLVRLLEVEELPVQICELLLERFDLRRRFGFGLGRRLGLGLGRRLGLGLGRLFQLPVQVGELLLERRNLGRRFGLGRVTPRASRS